MGGKDNVAFAEPADLWLVIFSHLCSADMSRMYAYAFLNRPNKTRILSNPMGNVFHLGVLLGVFFPIDIVTNQL